MQRIDLHPGLGFRVKAWVLKRFRPLYSGFLFRIGAPCLLLSLSLCKHPCVCGVQSLDRMQVSYSCVYIFLCSYRYLDIYLFISIAPLDVYSLLNWVCFWITDFEMYDLVVAMDHSNLRNLSRICPSAYKNKLKLLIRDYAPECGTEEVPDP